MSLFSRKKKQKYKQIRETKMNWFNDSYPVNRIEFSDRGRIFEVDINTGWYAAGAKWTEDHNEITVVFRKKLS